MVLLKLSELFQNSPGRKVILSGNEALARGIFESGVKFAANYPGTPLSEVGDCLNYLAQILEGFTFDYSINEKVALESCVGASWAGAKAVAMFKHMGLNVAADPLHTFPYSGTNGGMLILCGGDPGISSSTNAQDNRLYSLHTKIPFIEPATIQECKDFISLGLRFSELYRVPIYVNLTSRICHSSGIVVLGEIQKISSNTSFIKDPDRFINTLQRALTNQKKYFKIIQQISKDKKLFHLFNKIKTFEINSNDIAAQNKGIGILTSGVCYGYVIQACRKLQINPPILKLGLVFPINREEICEFSNTHNLKKILIVEELEPFIETFSKRVFCNFCDAKRDLEIYGKDFLPSTNELNTDLVMRFFIKHFTVKNQHLLNEMDQKELAIKEIVPGLPLRDPTFCPGCQYRPVFYALKKSTEDFEKKYKKSPIYAGDIGCYTLSESYPFQLLDWVICMGAGIGIANGMSTVIDKTKQHLIAFIGDSTLFHCGFQPLFNAIKNGLEMTIVIFNNSWTAMTGHQEHAGTPLDLIQSKKERDISRKKALSLVDIVKATCTENVTVTDAYNIEKVRRIFLENFSKKGTKIIIINEECALEKGRRLKNLLKGKIGAKTETFYGISESCAKCNECIEFLGCPAINAEHIEGSSDVKYYIDESRCIPDICPGICKTVCKNNMIKKSIFNPHLKTEGA